MSTELKIFGTVYNNVTGIKAEDSNGVTHTFVESGGADTTWTVTNTLTGVTNTFLTSKVVNNQPYYGQLVIPLYNSLENCAITMGNTDITSSAFDYNTYAIYIASVSDNISIIASSSTAVGPNTPYISGLGLHLDGIDNQATGTHNSEATTWVDKVNGHIFTQTPSDSAYTFDSDHFDFNGTQIFTSSINSKSWGTIEVVIEGGSGTQMVFETANTSSSNLGSVSVKSNSVLFQTGGSKSTALLSGVHTYSCNKDKIFVDGLEASSAGVTVSWSAGISSWYVGQYSQGGYKYSGNVYSIRCYDEQLTDEEILHNATIDYYRFRQESSES